MSGIYGSISELLKSEFGIELPDVETVKQNISDLWDKVKAGIANFFTTAFDIIMDDDTTITEKIGSLWELVKSGIAGYFKTVFDVWCRGLCRRFFDDCSN